MEFTPTDLILKGRDTSRSSKSLELNISHANRASSTLKAFKAFDFKRETALSSKNVCEEVAESTQTGPNRKKGRPRKGENLEPKTDASEAVIANKPLTRSKGRADSQSQSQSVHPRSRSTSTSEKEAQLIVQTKIPNGSGLTSLKLTTLN